MTKFTRDAIAIVLLIVGGVILGVGVCILAMVLITVSRNV